jgi:hypothetical protein
VPANAGGRSRFNADTLGPAWLHSALDEKIMSLPLLILGAGLAAVVVLIAYTLKRKAYAVLGLSLGVIIAFVLLGVAAYQIQMGYDHMHMTWILKSTASAIRSGNADAVVAAYDRFSMMRTNAGVTFWDARNQLYADLAKLGTTTNGIQPDAGGNSR